MTMSGAVTETELKDLEDLEDLNLGSVFPEPPRPPSPEPTIATYLRSQAVTKEGEEDIGGKGSAWTEIEIRLVGTHTLWGHYLWNAARAFATYLDAHERLYRDKNVLELGAGGGLPGLVTALNGARKTVLTDYPDQALLDNLALNVERNVPAPLREGVRICGHVWGAPVAPLLAVAPEKFDLVILSDLVFNHSQHDALLKTCELTIRDAGSPDHNDSDDVPTILVFYTHHVPHLAARDLDFFAKARRDGWTCENILTERYSPMFPDDQGEEEVRSTVHGWRLTRVVGVGYGE